MNKLSPLIEEYAFEASRELHNDLIDELIRHIARSKLAIVSNDIEIKNNDQIEREHDGFWVQTWTYVRDEEVDNELLDMPSLRS